MILGITSLIFLGLAPFAWRRGPEGTGVAFGFAVAAAVAVALFAILTGFTGVGREWRVEAIFCGIVLVFAFVGLGIARAS